jgi:hypothetical protein
MRYVGCNLRNPNAETLAVIEITISFDYETYSGWISESIRGLLVVGKGASRGEGVSGAVKQLDFNFEWANMNLNFDTSHLSPPLNGFSPTNEKGFFLPVVELLTHSYRKHNKFGSRESVQPELPSCGRYHCGVPFDRSYQSVNLISAIQHHASGTDLVRSYHRGEPIHNILDRLVGADSLGKGWLDVKKFGDFV